MNLRVFPRAAFAFLLSLCTGAGASAATEVQTQYRSYEDEDTKVTTPSLDIDTTFNKDQMKVGVGIVQDVLTSASSDVLTYSSQGRISDRRTEYSTNFESLVPDGNVGVGYVQSDEVDYSSKIVSASGTREFFQKNTVVGLGFSNGQDRILNVTNKDFKESMNHQIYSLSVTQILSRVSLVQFLYDLRIENGFVASPYRKAKFRRGDTITALPENHPRTRNRNAFAVKYNYFSREFQTTLATTYRIYYDSWGVNSHTLEERVTKDFASWFSLSLGLRYYFQQAASFYEDYYEGDPPPFYTGNNTLASYDSIMVSARPTINFTDSFGFFLKYELYKQKYRNASAAGQLSDPNDDKKLTTDATVVGIGIFAKF